MRDETTLNHYLWQPWFPALFFTNILRNVIFTNEHKLLKQMEKKLTSLFNQNVIIFPSGTSAILTALEVLLPETEGEIIVSPLVCESVIDAIYQVGKSPVFLDVDSNNYAMDLSTLDEAITPSTQAIIAIHQFGYPINMKKICEIANKHNLIVIEDAAQSLGAQISGELTGTFGDVGVLSFNNKVIDTCGGGALIVNNSVYKMPILDYRNSNYFLTRNSFIRLFIRSYLLSNFPYLATILSRKIKQDTVNTQNTEIFFISLMMLNELLPHLEWILSKRKSNYETYANYLTNSDMQKSFSSSLDYLPSYTYYTFILGNRICTKRAFLLNQLKLKGIFVSSLINKPNIIDKNLRLPISEHLYYYSISLPTGPNCNEKDIIEISSILNDLLSNTKYATS
jgi:dTDP-4-amino-4,6-dideoxygalactose transaminase